VHEDEAVDEAELEVAAEGAFDEGDDEGEEEDGVGVEGAGGFFGEVIVGEPGGEPDLRDMVVSGEEEERLMEGEGGRLQR